MDLSKHEQEKIKNHLPAFNQVRVRTNVRAGGAYVAGVYYPDKSGSCSSGIAVQLPDMFPVYEGTATQLPDMFPVYEGTATQLPGMFPVYDGTATQLPEMVPAGSSPSYVWVDGQKIYDMSGYCR